MVQFCAISNIRAMRGIGGLKRLQAMGYIQRSRDLADERQVRVTLTQRGREIRDQAAGGRREIVCASSRTEEEIEALRRELNQLRGALLREAHNAEDEGAHGHATVAAPMEGRRPQEEGHASSERKHAT